MAKWIPEAGDIVQSSGNKIYIVIEGEVQKSCYYLVRSWKYFRGVGAQPFTVGDLQKYKKVGHMPDIQKHLNKLFIK